MTIEQTNIEGVLVLTPKVFKDERGYFFESFNQKEFERLTGLAVNFVQDNQSKSQKDVLRGLHFQKPPYAQGKLVRVLSGSVIDVVVDIRPHSPTYGKHFKIILSDNNHKMVWIPEGMAHGFATLEDNTVFFYKCTNYYHKESEGAILWNDNDLAIDWTIENPILSEKDKKASPFSSFNSPF